MSMVLVSEKIVKENALAKSISFDEFLGHCVCCGGNWVAMIFSGYKYLFPKVWDELPEKAGNNGVEAMCNLVETLNALGVVC